MRLLLRADFRRMKKPQIISSRVSDFRQAVPYTRDAGRRRAIKGIPAFVTTGAEAALKLAKIAHVLVRLDHVARIIVNANHSFM